MGCIPGDSHGPIDRLIPIICRLGYVSDEPRDML